MAEREVTHRGDMPAMKTLTGGAARRAVAAAAGWRLARTTAGSASATQASMAARALVARRAISHPPVAQLWIPPRCNVGRLSGNARITWNPGDGGMPRMLLRLTECPTHGRYDLRRPPGAVSCDSLLQALGFPVSHRLRPRSILDARARTRPADAPASYRCRRAACCRLPP